MYDLRGILKQEPAAIVAVLAHFFALAVALGWLSISATAVGLVDSLALALLTLFYIRPLTTSNAALAAIAPGTVPDAGDADLGPDPGI